MQSVFENNSLKHYAMMYLPPKFGTHPAKFENFPDWEDLVQYIMIFDIDGHNRVTEGNKGLP
jgi:hypothetical protein